MHELLMANKDSEILPAENAHDSPCDFNEDLSTVQPSSLADTLSLYLESCEPFQVTNSEPANNLDEPNISRTDALVGPFNSIVLTEFSESRDNNGKDIIENKIKESKRSSTRRTTRKSSSNQLNITKLTARKSRKSNGKRQVLDLLSAEVGKGQRSNLVRRARLSPWGLGRKIDEIFKENAAKYVDANEHLESRKGNMGGRGAKRNTDSAHQNIQNSLAESRVSNKGLLLKFKLGTKAVQNCQFNTIPDVEKDVDSYREVKVEASTLQTDIKNNYENEKQILGASIENLDKEIVSSKSVENGCLDPGTSPDSEVINVILETQISGTNTTEGLVHHTQISSKDSISHQSTSEFGAGSGIPSPEIVNDVLSCDKFVNGDNKQIEGSWSSGASNGQNPMEPKFDDHGIPGIESVESPLSEKLKSNGPNIEKSSRSKGIIKSMSGVPGLVNKKKTNCGLKGSQCRSAAKGKIKEKTGKGLDFDTETYQVTGCHGMNAADAGGLYNSNMVPSEGDSRLGSPPSAWVCCDDCHKWRRISAVLADAIESTECRWICKDNMDKAFADCSIPQEKSNADINEELELSEASCEEDACHTRLNSSQLGQKQQIDTPQPSWKLIKTNMFLHRNRKNQPIDEVMVCHCRPPLDGRMGCRDECLNRMLNIECVKGTCPCGELCSNQQFQKRKYSKLKCVPSGKKGYGLQLQEDIPKGRFLIEYVGEVLDMPAYEARQREYASKGHKHFYFMTLNGSEVIDACAKGNLGRFINHSCEPNCRTEKWMVNGEVCIGLFAVRDIKKGEELTFDYNYVRVFGAAAKKCVCGSSRCRGVIGGDPLTDETVVLGDSDEEYQYPEPVMFYENSNNKLDTAISMMQTPESISQNNVEDDQIPDSLLVTDEKTDDPAILVESTEREVSFDSKIEQTEELLSSCVVPLDKKMKSETELQNENIVNLLPEDGDSKKKLNAKSHTNEKNRMVLKPQSHSKLHSPSSAVKRGKSKSKKPEIDSKPPVVPQKPKKIVVGNLTGRFEAVEEALNTLLTKGGISKRRDASKGYLTLLCLTANGGNGEGIQSNRDLSMILDALLRTKSRTVLLDIINKNGLQMLHILMKRYRKVFNKTPILRKLLKVLEFLAETKILSVEHILKPSLPGVESFKESILSLTEHADKEVHQIARNFRDRYIPWSARRINRAERDTERKEFHQNSSFRSFQLQQNRETKPCEVADNCIIRNSLGGNTNTPPVDATTLEGSSASCRSSCTDGTRIRKRKSRWDQPASPSKKECRSKLGGEDMNNVNGDGDAPPGFSSPINHPSNPSSASHHCKTVMGQPQDRYISRLPTAFGIPCSLLKKIGTPEEGGAAAESWIVAPAMTFHPFPPLPVYPRGENRHARQESWGKCTDRNRVPFSHPYFPRDRNSNTLGRRYFKQQKWNNTRSGFPWNPNKYGPAGFSGPNKNQPNIGVGYGGNEANGTHNTSSYHQQQPHHQ